MKYVNIIKKNAIFLLIVISIILYFVLKDDFINIINTLANANFKWLIFSFVFISLYWLLRSACLYIISREYARDLKFYKIFQVTLITQFFNGITPFSSGGQPMEVYYLSKCGIKPTRGTNIILQNFIMYQMALIAHGIIAITLNYKFHFFKKIPILRELTTLGFVINILVGVGLLFISFCSKFNKKVINLIIKICSKLKLVKDIEKTTSVWEEKLDEFHDSAELLKRKRMLFFRGFIYNFVALAIFYVIPIFIIYGMGSFDINAIETIAASAYVLIIGSFVPIPGGSGGIEYGFMQFFGNFISGPALSASLLVWRFITYYLGMILGTISISLFRGDVKK